MEKVQFYYDNNFVFFFNSTLINGNLFLVVEGHNRDYWTQSDPTRYGMILFVIILNKNDLIENVYYVSSSKRGYWGVGCIQVEFLLRKRYI